MGNSLRCCLACILPCGALDVIRIVHLSGHVEELSHSILVKEVISANPNHVLTKPCSHQGLGHKILILSPNSELKRGHFYFLIPASSIPNNNNNKLSSSTANQKKKPTSSKQKIMEKEASSIPPNIKCLSVKKASRRRQCSAGQIGIWRPNLDSICED